MNEHDTVRTPVPSARQRTAVDLDSCIQVLAVSHQRDGDPLRWPGSAGAWLAQPSQHAAWVTELGGRITGHAACPRRDGRPRVRAVERP